MDDELVADGAPGEAEGEPERILPVGEQLHGALDAGEPAVALDVDVRNNVFGIDLRVSSVEGERGVATAEMEGNVVGSGAAVEGSVERGESVEREGVVGLPEVEILDGRAAHPLVRGVFVIGLGARPVVVHGQHEVQGQLVLDGEADAELAGVAARTGELDVGRQVRIGVEVVERPVELRIVEGLALADARADHPVGDLRERPPVAGVRILELDGEGAERAGLGGDGIADGLDGREVVAGVAGRLLHGGGGGGKVGPGGLAGEKVGKGLAVRRAGGGKPVAALRDGDGRSGGGGCLRHGARALRVAEATLRLRAGVALRAGLGVARVARGRPGRVVFLPCGAKGLLGGPDGGVRLLGRGCGGVLRGQRARGLGARGGGGPGRLGADGLVGVLPGGQRPGERPLGILELPLGVAKGPFGILERLAGGLRRLLGRLQPGAGGLAGGLGLRKPLPGLRRGCGTLGPEFGKNPVVERGKLGRTGGGGLADGVAGDGFLDLLSGAVKGVHP